MRQGGEEFGVLLPGMNLREAGLWAEILRVSIEDAKKEHQTSHSKQESGIKMDKQMYKNRWGVWFMFIPMLAQASPSENWIQEALAWEQKQMTVFSKEPTLEELRQIDRWQEGWLEDQKQGLVFFNRLDQASSCSQMEKLSWEWIKASKTVSGAVIAFEVALKKTWVSCPMTEHRWKEAVVTALNKKTTLSWGGVVQMTWADVLNAWVIEENMACEWGGKSCNPDLNNK